MADTQPTADPQPKGNDNGGKPEADLAGAGKDKGSDNKPAAQTDLAKQNEELRGTISALTKKIDASDSEKKSFMQGLAKLAGVDTDSGKTPEPSELIAALGDRVGRLEGNERKSAAKAMLEDAIENFVDEDGKPLPSEIKNYLRKDLDVSEPDQEKVVGLVKGKVSALKSAFGNNIVKTAPDRGPERGGWNLGGDSVRKKTANEILAEQKERK